MDLAAIDLQKIQLSFIHVGIRDYTDIGGASTGYPIQNAVTRDSFIFFSAVTADVGEMAGSAIDFVVTNDATVNALSGANQQLFTYLGANTFGHVFCGIIRA